MGLVMIGILLVSACQGISTPVAAYPNATDIKSETVQFPTPSKSPITKTPIFSTEPHSFAETQTIQFDLAEHDDYKNNYSISPSGTMLAVGNAKSARVYLIDGKGEIWNEEFSFEIRSLSWSSDNNRLAIGNTEGQVLIWDISKKHLTKNFVSSAQGTGIDKWIDRIQWSPDGELLAAASVSGTLDVWNIESDEKVLANQVSTGIGTVMGINFSPDNSFIAIGTADFYPDDIHVFELANGNEVKLIRQSQSKLQQNDRVAYVSYKSNGFSVPAKYSPPPAGCGGFTDTAWSPNGKMLVAVNQCEHLTMVWDTSTWNLLYSLHGGFTFVTWSADGKYMATDDVICENHLCSCFVQIWNITSGTTESILTSHTSEYSRDLVWTNSGKIILVNHTGDVVIWNFP